MSILDLLRGPSIHPPVGLWDSVEGSRHQTRVQMLTLKRSAARRAGDHSHPQSPFLRVGFVILPPRGSAGLVAERPCYTAGIQNVVPVLEASPERAVHSPPAQAGKESGSGGPQPPEGLTGTKGSWRLIRA